MGKANALERAIDRAVNRIERYGIDGPRPLDELEALNEFGDRLPAAVRAAVEALPLRRLAAGIHLARLLRLTDLAESLAAAALRRPAPVEAKAEALEFLEEAEVEVPDPVHGTLAAARSFLGEPTEEGLQVVLEMPDAWRQPTLRAWLADGDERRPELLEHALGTDSELDAMIVDRLGGCGSVEAVPVLQQLATSDERPLQKAAKRALHRLRSGGVTIQEADPVEGFSLEIAPDIRAESRAYVTGVDGVGGRILWLMTPWRSGGYRLLEAVMDDTEGLRKADVLAVTGKDFRAHVARLRETSGLLIVQVEPAHAAGLVAAAEQRGGDGTRSDDYRRWRDEVAGLFEGVETAPPSPAAGLVAELQSSWREVLPDSVELLGDAAFGSWAADGPEVATAAAAVRTAETSELALDEEQRKTQVDRAISGVAEVFDSALRARYRGRLEEMAAVLLALRRDEDARRAVAAAIGFTEVADLYAEHPFARAIIQRGVLTAYQGLREEEERATAGSKIIKP